MINPDDYYIRGRGRLVTRPAAGSGTAVGHSQVTQGIDVGDLTDEQELKPVPIPVGSYAIFGWTAVLDADVYGEGVLWPGGDVVEIWSIPNNGVAVDPYYQSDVSPARAGLDEFGEYGDTVLSGGGHFRPETDEGPYWFRITSGGSEVPAGIRDWHLWVLVFDSADGVTVKAFD